MRVDPPYIHKVSAADQLLRKLQLWMRSQSILYRLTLGTRVLLAVGFIPTGMVKLLGLRFSYMSPETAIGGFFETLYLSGPYWHFLGLTQVVAGILVLWPLTATIGALLFFAIILNVFVITISYDFNFTPVITGGMLLATVYLLLWDYHRLRSLVGSGEHAEGVLVALPRHRLSGAAERGVYVVGLIAGLAFFSATRGLVIPMAWNVGLVLTCLLCFVAAVGYGLKYRKAAPTTEVAPVAL